MADGNLGAEARLEPGVPGHRSVDGNLGAEAGLEPGVPGHRSVDGNLDADARLEPGVRATALWMGIRAWMPGCSLAAVGCESLALPGAPLCG